MRLSELWIYPVKSARGLSLTEAEVGDRGLAGDRRFMIVDEHGRFLTQRTLPRMCLLSTAIEGDTLRLFGAGVAISVPVRPRAGIARRVEVWGDFVDAWSLGPEAAAQLSRFLGVTCELIYMPDETERAVDPDYAPRGQIVGFADAFPFLLTTTASLAELARRGAPVEMVRFRPNLVVGGAEPFAEDGWQTLRIGEVTFQLVKPCARCAIPNVDPESGEVGTEPTRTLATFRKREGKILFGQNAIALSRGRLRVGDPVTVGQLG